MADKEFSVEGAAPDESRDTRVGLGEEEFEDIDLSPELLGEEPGTGHLEVDPGAQEILRKYGNDPIKLALAYKDAQSLMHRATEDRKRLEREVDEQRFRMNELRNQQAVNTIPGGGSASSQTPPQYYYQPPFNSPDEFDGTNFDHIWWASNEAAARQRVEGKREMQQELQKAELTRRDEACMAAHPEVPTEEWRRIFQVMKTRGIRELEDGYEKVMGNPGNKTRTRRDSDETRKIINRVADNMRQPSGLRSSGGGGGTKTLTMDDLINLSEEDFRKFPEALQQKILGILPPPTGKY